MMEFGNRIDGVLFELEGAGSDDGAPFGDPIPYYTKATAMLLLVVTATATYNGGLHIHFFMFQHSFIQ